MKHFCTNPIVTYAFFSFSIHADALRKLKTKSGVVCSVVQDAVVARLCFLTVDHCGGVSFVTQPTQDDNTQHDSQNLDHRETVRCFICSFRKRLMGAHEVLIQMFMDSSG